MMGERQVAQEALFYEFSLERHVPPGHWVRAIDRFVDLSDIRAHLRPFYSEKGRPSIDPELIIRILLLETVLSLGDPLGGFGGARGYDQCAVSENKGCKNQQSQKNIRHVTAVFLEEKLSSVHCFAEGLLLGYMLLCHMKNILF